MSAPRARICSASSISTQCSPNLAYTSGLVPGTTKFTSANETTLNLLRPYQGYNAIGAIEPWFNSNYHSLQVSGQKQLTGDSLVCVLLHLVEEPDRRPDRPLLRAAEPLQLPRRRIRARRCTTARMSSTSTSSTTFPFFRNRQGLVGKALGGWEVSGIGSYYTGLPYTVTTSGTDPARSRHHRIQPGQPAPGSHLRCQRRSADALPVVQYRLLRQRPAAGQHRVGNEGRGVIRGPGYEGWSFSASKNVKFGEGDRYRFQLRGEASNAFNHTNPSTFGSLANTSTLFGTITGYRDPRIIQLAAKFYF